MSSYRFLSIAMLALLAVGGAPAPVSAAGSDQPSAPAGSASLLPFRGLAYGALSKIRGSRFLTIRDEATWQKLWREHTGADTGRPSVDFQKHMVVAVFAGVGVGYEIHVAAVEPQAAQILVKIEKLCIMPQVTQRLADATTPFNIVEMPRQDRPVVFSETVIHPAPSRSTASVAAPDW